MVAIQKGGRVMEVVAVFFVLIFVTSKWVWRDIARGYHAFELELKKLRNTSKEGD